MKLKWGVQKNVCSTGLTLFVDDTPVAVVIGRRLYISKDKNCICFSSYAAAKEYAEALAQMRLI